MTSRRTRPICEFFCDYLNGGDALLFDLEYNQFIDLFIDRSNIKTILPDIELAPKSRAILFEAFTHSSFAHEFKRFKLSNNERLEFLGDSLIQVWITETIYHKFEDVMEGKLSKLRGSIVNGKVLAKMAQFLDLGQYLLLGKGETTSMGYEKSTILSDCFEAYWGAIYFILGPEDARKYFLKFCNEYQKLKEPDLFDLSRLDTFDPKTKLQEILAKELKTSPEYRLEKEEAGEFLVALYIKDQFIESMSGHSKKKIVSKLADNCLKQESYRRVSCS